MINDYYLTLTLSDLKNAAKTNPDSVIRLAKYLRLSVEGLSNRNVAKLIRWRITRPDMVKRDPWLDAPLSEEEKLAFEVADTERGEPF